MKKAIQEARKSAGGGQYAVGAVVILGGKVLAKGKTMLHKTNDPTAHAEINAIRYAAKKLKSRYILRGWLYTTHEPCPMCTSAAIWAKMEGVVYGASMKDSIRVYKKQKGSKFTYRQIGVPAEQIVDKGEPRVKLYKEFMRSECLKLFKLTG